MNDTKRILVADSGATKTDWVCLTEDATGMRTDCISGMGLSPLHHSECDIIAELQRIAETFGHEFDRIRFYGTGIGSPKLESQTGAVLGSVFHSIDIIATSDILGAAKALYGDKKGVACIMGTGSSSCHYDGKQIDFRIPSLGYFLDDDGGGVAFGRRLLADIFKVIAPEEIRQDFLKIYPITREDLIVHLYKQQAPNRWMASFFPFIAEHRDNSYISSLIKSQIERFLDREFSGYPTRMLSEEGVAFVGSVADILMSPLAEALESRHWKYNGTIRKPIENIHNLTI